AVDADGRSRRRRDQDRDARRRRRLALHDRAAGQGQHLLRDQQSRREKRDAQPQVGRGKAILHKLVAKADIFGQNFRPSAAERNGFGWDELRKTNPKLAYVSISGYGTRGPNGHLPGTDSMAQALGGIAEAYSQPGQKMRTGIASVADESTAMLAFGGALAALHHARTTGVGQKIELSLLGSLVRLLGWTFTTTMWRDRNPVTGQARVTGTAERPGISASFNDKDGKPLVFQL